MKNNWIVYNRKNIDIIAYCDSREEANNYVNKLLSEKNEIFDKKDLTNLAIMNIMYV